MNEEGVNKTIVYEYTEHLSDQYIIEYRFWRKSKNKYWRVLETHYQVDKPSHTIEYFLPDAVLNIILADEATEILKD